MPYKGADITEDLQLHALFFEIPFRVGEIDLSGVLRGEL